MESIFYIDGAGSNGSCDFMIPMMSILAPHELVFASLNSSQSLGGRSMEVIVRSFNTLLYGFFHKIAHPALVREIGACLVAYTQRKEIVCLMNN